MQLQEHEALKKDYTSLKEDYTSLKEAKMKVVGKKMLSCTPQNVSATTSQLYTLLVDTSTMERGSTLSLALSESNIKSGHHYIKLEGYIFKLEWEQQQQQQQQQEIQYNYDKTLFGKQRSIKSMVALGL